MVMRMSFYDRKEVEEELGQLTISKMKLDKFFSFYLDKVGSKMDAKRPNTPEWALYHKKFNEYEEIDRQIKHLKYKLTKAI